MKNIALLLITTLFHFISFAQADSTRINPIIPEWLYVTATNDGDCYVKSSYVKKENGLIYVWVKDKLKTFKWKGKVYINVTNLSLEVFDCTEKQSGYVELIYYKSSGDILIDESYDISMHDIIPDTRGEAILNKVCNLFNL